MPRLEVSNSRLTQVGAMPVRRALPRRAHRTVGAWCFADHMGPATVTAQHGLDIGPHPHTGLQTVTYLVSGEALHRDSLGSEQLITPGQVNLMSAGLGVSHSEEATGHYAGDLHGIQLWIAQPDATRHASPAFEHHAQLPRIAIDQSLATVLVGEFHGVRSPARHDTALVGVELSIRHRIDLQLQADFEYAIIVLEGALSCDGVDVAPGQLGYLGIGNDEITLHPYESTRAMLLGGEPFESDILIWWNFVARNREEIDRAYDAWRSGDGRFGDFTSHLERISAPTPYWRDSP
ncbi:MAG: pirin family protein [Acidimicrobiales bacterium]